MAYIGKKPTDKPLTSADLNDNIVTSAKIVDGTIADADINDVAGSKLTGTVADARISTLTASKLTGALPAISGANLTGLSVAYDDNKLQSNIALLGFKTAVNGSLAKYNLQDQIIDEYEDASGIDAAASTNENLNLGAYSGASTGATGGTITTHGSYTVHSITSTGSTDFIVTTSGSVDALMVAGGGAGGRDQGNDVGAGGGGAGGMLVKTSEALTAQTYAIVVGAGAATTTSGYLGANGSNTTAFGYTSVGGGGGGGASGGAAGSAGGSGGGSRNGGTAGAGTTDQGNAGEVGGNDPNGGGGGAGEAGGTDGTGLGGDGADNDYQTGSNIAYSGGGGGGNKDGPLCLGGTGGGGTGGANIAGVAGTDGLGGGGGGAGGLYNGGAGGNGVVIIRYLTGAFDVYTDLTLQSTDTTSLVSNPTSGDMVMLMQNNIGTATLDTDIKGYISRDSGTTFTQGTLVDEGTWGTNKKILAFHDLDISGQPSGTSMCYKITTHNQSASSKEAYIHATSIGWK